MLRMGVRVSWRIGVRNNERMLRNQLTQQEISAKINVYGYLDVNEEEQTEEKELGKPQELDR